MARVVIVHRTDVHIADRPPVSRRDDYASAIIGKLAIVGDLARKIGADAVVDSGDFFHIQAPSRNSHGLVQRVMEVHETHYTCPVYFVLGNHDLAGGNPESVSRQPIGTLLRARTFTSLGDVTLGGHDRPRVRLVGVPYAPHPTLASLRVERGSEDVLVEVCHAYTVAPGTGASFQELSDEPVFSWEELSSLPADVWLGGHYHRDQGSEVVGGKRFVFPGSLSRGVYSRDEMDRLPRIAVITFEGEEGGPVQTNVRLVRLTGLPVAEEIFDVRARAVDREVTDRISAFVTSLMSDTAKADPLEAVASRGDVPPEIRERAAGYLRRAMGEGR